jgi:apolipoprotein N-acyltransferase
VLDARLPQPAAPTVYARTGDSIAGIVVVMALVWVFVARRRRAQR